MFCGFGAVGRGGGGSTFFYFTQLFIFYNSGEKMNFLFVFKQKFRIDNAKRWFSNGGILGNGGVIQGQ